MEHPILEKQAFKRLGFKKLETSEIVSALNTSLASYQIFFHKLQCFHWNVIGNDFYDVHDVTEEMYKKGLAHIDELAERIRVFGQIPEVRLSQYLKLSIVEESSPDKSSEYMMYDLLSDLEKLSETLLTVHEYAGKNGDIGTVYMVSRMIKELETNHWKLSSWTSSKFS